MVALTKEMVPSTSKDGMIVKEMVPSGSICEIIPRG